jgi:hypothetical protein
VCTTGDFLTEKIKIMCITFNDLPQAVEQVLEEIKVIKELLTQKENINKEVSSLMNFDEALDFMSKAGYPMSKSKLYKLTANKQIPHIQFCSKLIFNREELLEWCQSQSKNIEVKQVRGGLRNGNK